MLKYMLLNLMAILFVNNRTWANKQKCDREISEESEIQQSEAILQSICGIRYCISRLDVEYYDTQICPWGMERDISTKQFSEH